VLAGLPPATGGVLQTRGIWCSSTYIQYPYPYPYPCALTSPQGKPPQGVTDSVVGVTHLTHRGFALNLSLCEMCETHTLSHTMDGLPLVSNN